MRFRTGLFAVVEALSKVDRSVAPPVNLEFVGLTPHLYMTKIFPNLWISRTAHLERLPSRNLEADF